jgi:hypothetical protein
MRHETFRLPPRPDASVLSDSIPLFFVGQNHNGFWVAREAEGPSGGLFVLKRSALRFVRKNNERRGVATMFVTKPLELDVENQGSRFVALLAAAMDSASRRVPVLTAFIRMSVAEWRNLVAQLRRSFVGSRRVRD